MNHVKTHHAVQIDSSKGTVVIEGPLSSHELANYDFHEDLKAFRPADKQFEAVKKIADFEEGRIIVARTDTTIVGYVTYLYPDPLERWSEFNMKDLIELGAIEVIPDYRGEHVASKLLKVSMLDEAMEDFIVISTEYYWHWDLSGTKLNVWQYRAVMEKMMSAGGLTPYPTDDPEIVSHPANCLMARIGRNIPKQSVDQFEKLRFLGRHQHRFL
ncbi:acetoin dehydrogenase [Pontibacillus halophilus JSM 076056 = DSM 19796]|uniref:Acetoin dehydrogenase n=1 Tax=Pontibacillus halophilus JSM 076056 = DSM 19796 TaxID=1385510 RepID=A0A0A5GDW0_9BACI|nr:GNAT family N-acetyltransferase [Pontibacillus halophilus]KGX89393.1 acetoin dehydrogenase [Pontibacillus halophilus JSM 076056 = DSM 19796]